MTVPAEADGLELRSTRFEKVAVGDVIPSFDVPLSLQRLVMEAGVNRDFTPLHHDPEDARVTGAPDAYANTIFIQAMLEATLRNWMGDTGELKELDIRMVRFNLRGSVIRAGGQVSRLSVVGREGRATLELWMRSDENTTVTATAVVSLPTNGSGIGR
jgi:acyl dehydratase